MSPVLGIIIIVIISKVCRSVNDCDKHQAYYTFVLIMA